MVQWSARKGAGLIPRLGGCVCAVWMFSPRPRGKQVATVFVCRCADFLCVRCSEQSRHLAVSLHQRIHPGSVRRGCFSRQPCDWPVTL